MESFQSKKAPKVSSSLVTMAHLNPKKLKMALMALVKGQLGG